MFAHIFFTLIRSLLIPGIAIFTVSRATGDLRISFLGVLIISTIVTVPMTIFHTIKILPSLVLLQFGSVMEKVAEIIVEISVLIGLWVIYIYMFGI